MQPNRIQIIKGWLLVKRTLLLELLRPTNRVIMIVSDNRTTLGIFNPKFSQSIAFINGIDKANRGAKQLRKEVNNITKLEKDMDFEETPQK